MSLRRGGRTIDLRRAAKRAAKNTERAAPRAKAVQKSTKRADFAQLFIFCAILYPQKEIRL